MHEPRTPDPWSREASERARAMARRLTDLAASRRPDLFEMEGVDLRGAVEQALFGRLRGGGTRRRDAHAAISRARSVARIGARTASSLLRRPAPEPGDIVVVLLTAAQVRIVDSIREELVARNQRIFLVFESQDRRAVRDRPGAARLVDQLDPGRALRLLGFERRLAFGLSKATRDFDAVLDRPTARLMRRTMADSMGRIAFYATCLEALASRRPALMTTFNEIGRWSRLLAQAARRHDVPSLDIAHAEAADEIAIQGVDYDRFAVFGPAAARVLERAGVPPQRIVQVGAPRFDRLIERHRGTPTPPAERRVVFASQWLGGQMTAAVKRRTLEAALAAAEAVAPCEFVVRLHPIERDKVVRQSLPAVSPPGVSIHVEESGDLYDTLDGAWLMVTGWSNTVFEAILSHVPALCVTATGREPPTRFASEGLALSADGPASAAQAAASLLDPDAWVAALDRARGAIADHLGPLDGCASERAADLMIRLASR
jgi:hypothetical protein